MHRPGVTPDKTYKCASNSSVQIHAKEEIVVQDVSHETASFSKSSALSPKKWSGPEHRRN